MNGEGWLDKMDRWDNGGMGMRKGVGRWMNRAELIKSWHMDWKMGHGVGEEMGQPADGYT